MLFLKRLLVAVLTLGLFVVALVFASIFLAMAVGAAMVIGGWLWWRTRHLRKQAAHAATAPPPSGTILEGEFRVERDVPRLDTDKPL